MAWEWLGPTTTALVGVAGIMGTIVGATQARQAQLEVARLGPVQALLAEKRVAYARFLREAEDLLEAAERVRAALKSMDKFRSSLHDPNRTEDLDDATRQELIEAVEDVERKVREAKEGFDRARLVATRSRSELAVLGGLDVSVCASRLIGAAASFAGGSEDDGPVTSALLDATQALHLDTDPTRSNRYLIKELVARARADAAARGFSAGPSENY